MQIIFYKSSDLCRSPETQCRTH